MKTFITNFIKTTLVAAAFIASASFASAASFDSNPSGVTGIASIVRGDCSSCGGQYSSVSVSISNPGDSTYVTVFTDFMTQRGSSETVTNASGFYETRNRSGLSASSYTFGTTLSASNAGSVSDSVTVTGLPSSYSIDFESGHVENTHGGSNGCNAAYQYKVSVYTQLFSGGHSLGDLAPDGSGWCAQGTIAVKYKITNTKSVTPTDTYSWNTGSWGSCNSGTQTRNVQCVNQNGSQVSDSSCSGSKPTTSQSCSTGGGNHTWTSPSVQCTNGQVIASVGVTGNNGNMVQFSVDGGSWQNAQTNNSRSNLVIPSRSGIVEIHYRIPAYGNDSVFGAVTSIPNCGGTGNHSYRWHENGTWQQCSNGQQKWVISSLQCWDDVDTRFVNDSYCSSLTRPVSDGCVSGPTYHWVENGDWGVCSNNIQYQTIKCVNQNGSQVLDSNCYDSKPSNSRSCSSSTYSWNTGAWGSCNSGTQTRNVQCVNQNGSQVSDSSCSGSKPTTSQSCSTGETYSWNTGDWSSCSNGQRTRTVLCKSQQTGGIVNDSYCSGTKPTGVDTNSCSVNSVLEIETLNPTSIRTTSAVLNGTIINGEANSVYFVWATSQSNLNCTYSIKSHPTNWETNRFPGNDYSSTLTNLGKDVTYYYRACAKDLNGNIKQGVIKQFTTNDDSDDDDDITIETLSPRLVNTSSARLCGDYDGKEKTWIEFRPSLQSQYTQTTKIDRNSGEFCVDVNGLSPYTDYTYRACSDEDCDSTRTFRTLGGSPVNPGLPPVITTDNPTNIGSNSAVLNGTYVANNEAGTCYFNYGRTSVLGSKTRSYSTGSGYGSCVHNFTGLASGTQYCVQAVIENSKGRDVGAIKCFYTPSAPVVIRPSNPGNTNPTPVTPTPVVEITTVEEDITDIDLSKLGLGLSLVRLDIDDSQDVVTRGQSVEYVVEWQNISTIDLQNLDLKVTIPKEVQVTDISRGRIDVDENIVYFNITDLLKNEAGRIVIAGTVLQGSANNLLNAEATLAYRNPINQAQENATDFDVDEYGVQLAGVTASVFGLSNITFLGWLTILLGLFILFLIARWMYLEREEMRAHAYVNGYRPRPYLDVPGYSAYQDPRVHGYIPPQNYQAQGHQQPMASGYQDPRYGAPQVIESVQDEYYQPYRPNRG